MYSLQENSMLINFLGSESDQPISKYKNRLRNMIKEINILAFTCFIALALHSMTADALIPNLQRNKTSNSKDYLKLSDQQLDSAQHIFTSEGIFTCEIE